MFIPRSPEAGLIQIRGFCLRKMSFECGGKFGEIFSHGKCGQVNCEANPTDNILYREAAFFSDLPIQLLKPIQILQETYCLGIIYYLANKVDHDDEDYVKLNQ